MFGDPFNEIDSPTNCQGVLGAGGFATPVMVNADFLESVTAETVPDVLKRYG